MIKPTAFVKVKGTPIVLDGQKVIMPPLSLLHLEQFQERLKSFDGNQNNPDNISFVIDACHAALSRNYPDMTREDVAGGIGLEAMQELMMALVAVSGLTATTEELAALNGGDVGKPKADAEN